MQNRIESGSERPRPANYGSEPGPFGEGSVMDATFHEMRAKLERLSRLDRGRRIFASFRHQYRLNAPLPEGRVRKIERLIGVDLPEQYCQFVTEFADGGAGPKYGILPLERILDRTAFPRKLLRLIPHSFPASKSVRKMQGLGFDPPGTL